MPTESSNAAPKAGDIVYIAGLVLNTQKPYLQKHRLVAIEADAVVTEHLETYQDGTTKPGSGRERLPPEIMDYLSIPFEERMKQQAVLLNEFFHSMVAAAKIDSSKKPS
jgi:hypothetical protein